jgi:hypothetical protein
MLPEPLGKGFSTTVSQEINRPMRTQIHQDRSIGVATSKRKIIDSQEAWRLKGA